jgi:hypothetical protein
VINITLKLPGFHAKRAICTQVELPQRQSRKFAKCCEVVIIGPALVSAGAGGRGCG